MAPGGKHGGIALVVAGQIGMFFWLSCWLAISCMNNPAGISCWQSSCWQKHSNLVGGQAKAFGGQSIALVGESILVVSILAILVGGQAGGNYDLVVGKTILLVEAYWHSSWW